MEDHDKLGLFYDAPFDWKRPLQFVGCLLLIVFAMAAAVLVMWAIMTSFVALAIFCGVILLLIAAGVAYGVVYGDE